MGTDETPTESVLQALVDAESDAALFLRPLRDPGAGFVITNANPAAATLLNVTRSEPESDGPVPLHPDMLAVSQQAWETGRTEVREVLLPAPAPRPLQVRCRRLGHLVEMICVHVRQRATDDALDPSPRGQAEHERLRAVLDSSIDQQVVLNAVRDDTGQLEDLTCVDCNTAAARYLRRDRLDLLGRRLTSLFQGPSTEFTLTRAFEVIETGEPLMLSNHAMVSAITGDLRHFDISMVKTGDGVSFTWRDVTDSLRAARLLQDSEETLRLAMLHSPVAFCLVSPTGEFLHVNPAMCQLLGRDEPTLKTLTWQALTHPDDLATDVEQVREIAEDRQDSYRLTKRYVTGAGDTVWGDLAVSCIRDEHRQVRYLIGQIVDVTESFAHRNRLSVSEEHYRLLAENTSDVMAKVSSDGSLEWISPSVSDVFGWKPEELSGQPISAFISTGDWQRVAGVLDASRHPGMDAAGVFRIRRRNGSPIWVQATSSTVHTHDGEVVRIARLRDVDAETRARLDLQRSEERFRAAMSSTPVGMALVTRSGRFLKVNQALCRMLKQTESELTGAMVNTVTHPQDRPIDMEMWNLLHSGARSSVTREKRLVDTRGGIRWVQQALATVTDDDGERTSFVAQFVDTTATHEAQAVLAFQANHDPLTDLMNRRAVIDTIAAVLSHPPRTGTELGVLYCDFDHFKAINDKYGHQVGDDLLVEVARRIRRCVRAGDTVGRIGGDEFVVLLTQIHNIGDALRIGEKIRATVAQPFAIADAVFTPTVSMGAAVATHGEDPNTVLSNADRALYAAKDGGRNRVEGFSDTVA